MAAAEQRESLSPPDLFVAVRRRTRSSISLGRYPVRSWLQRGMRLSSLLFLTLVNQSSTISLTQRFNIPATLSFGEGGVYLRESSLSWTRSESALLSNGFWTISSASRRIASMAPFTSG